MPPSDQDKPAPPDTGFRNTAPTMGMPSWTEQDEQLSALWQKGEKPEAIAQVLNRSVAAVMTRAARLGLQRRFAPGRKPKKLGYDDMNQANLRNMAKLNAQLQTVQSQMSHRICLMCLSRFQSAGRHNRICQSCKDSPEYRSASSLPDVDIGGGE
jgi:hypothetical protein